MESRRNHWRYDDDRGSGGAGVHYPPPPGSPPTAVSSGLWTVSSAILPLRHSPLRRPMQPMSETETEDEPNPLPTSRIAMPQNLAQPSIIPRILPSVFLAFRLLSIVPAVVGILSYLYKVYDPPKCNSNGPIEYAVSILWASPFNIVVKALAILTAHQCLSFTTGLLHRWRVYYSLLPTLIRLLALQAICWPATHLTLKLFNHQKRPLVCWTIIGTTTCVSKAIELWVTSNLRRGPKDLRRKWYTAGGLADILVGPGPDVDATSSGVRNDAMGNIKGRRWNWNRVLVHCVAPPCLIYVIMAWALLLKREFEPSPPIC
ncbi:hypothetical protein FRB99_005787 [Tulasnella sp. 403]|nr:hypothetical protein FRB99_005787 [Tulasnella sp. 403]